MVLLAVILPVVVVGLILIICLTIFIICCKHRANRKREKRQGDDAERGETSHYDVTTPAKQNGSDVTQKTGTYKKHNTILRPKPEIVLKTPNQHGAELCVVRHFYEAVDGEQLTLRTGRIVEVLEKRSDGWWRGSIDDQKGWFPAQFVTKIDALDTSELKTRPLVPTSFLGYENVGFVAEHAGSGRRDTDDVGGLSGSKITDDVGGLSGSKITDDVGGLSGSKITDDIGGLAGSRTSVYGDAASVHSIVSDGVTDPAASSSPMITCTTQPSHREMEVDVREEGETLANREDESTQSLCDEVDNVDQVHSRDDMVLDNSTDIPKATAGNLNNTDSPETHPTVICETSINTNTGRASDLSSEHTLSSSSEDLVEPSLRSADASLRSAEPSARSAEQEFGEDFEADLGMSLSCLDEDDSLLESILDAVTRKSGGRLSEEKDVTASTRVSQEKDVVNTGTASTRVSQEKDVVNTGTASTRVSQEKDVMKAGVPGDLAITRVPRDVEVSDPCPPVDDANVDAEATSAAQDNADDDVPIKTLHSHLVPKHNTQPPVNARVPHFGAGNHSDTNHGDNSHGYNKDTVNLDRHVANGSSILPPPSDEVNRDHSNDDVTTEVDGHDKVNGVAMQTKPRNLDEKTGMVILGSSLAEETSTDPDSVVTMTNSPESHNRKTLSGGHKKYVCMYPFRGEGVDQLAVTPNDVVHGLCEDPAGWLWVLHVSTGKEGWLPANYLREAQAPGFQRQRSGDITDSQDELDSDNEFNDDVIAIEYRAIYPYAGDQAGDMALQPGDVVVVMEMLPTGWWRGCVDDREGWFPGSYVEMIPQGSVLPTSQGGVFTSNQQVSSKSNSLPAGPRTRRYASSPDLPVFDLDLTEKKEPWKNRKLSIKPELPKRSVIPKLVKVPKTMVRQTSKGAVPPRPRPPAPPAVKQALMKSMSLDSSRGQGRRRGFIQRPRAPPPEPPSTRISRAGSLSSVVSMDSGLYSRHSGDISSIAEVNPDPQTTITQVNENERNQQIQENVAVAVKDMRLDAGARDVRLDPAYNSVTVREVRVDSGYNFMSNRDRGNRPVVAVKPVSQNLYAADHEIYSLKDSDEKSYEKKDMEFNQKIQISPDVHKAPPTPPVRSQAAPVYPYGKRVQPVATGAVSAASKSSLSPPIAPQATTDRPKIPPKRPKQPPRRTSSTSQPPVPPQRKSSVDYSKQHVGVSVQQTVHSQPHISQHNSEKKRQTYALSAADRNQQPIDIRTTTDGHKPTDADMITDGHKPTDADKPHSYPWIEAYRPNDLYKPTDARKNNTVHKPTDVQRHPDILSGYSSSLTGSDTSLDGKTNRPARPPKPARKSPPKKRLFGSNASLESGTSFPENNISPVKVSLQTAADDGDSSDNQFYTPREHESLVEATHTQDVFTTPFSHKDDTSKKVPDNSLSRSDTSLYKTPGGQTTSPGSPPSNSSLRFFTPMGFSPPKTYTQGNLSFSASDISGEESWSNTTVMSAKSTPLDTSSGVTDPVNLGGHSQSMQIDLATPRPYRPPPIRLGTRNITRNPYTSSSSSIDSPTNDTKVSPTRPPPPKIKTRMLTSVKSVDTPSKGDINSTPFSRSLDSVELGFDSSYQDDNRNDGLLSHSASSKYHVAPSVHHVEAPVNEGKPHIAPSVHHVEAPVSQLVESTTHHKGKPHHAHHVEVDDDATHTPVAVISGGLAAVDDEDAPPPLPTSPPPEDDELEPSYTTINWPRGSHKAGVAESDDTFTEGFITDLGQRSDVSLPYLQTETFMLDLDDLEDSEV